MSFSFCFLPCFFVVFFVFFFTFTNSRLLITSVYFAATFLIPYFVMLAINGIPLFYMELAIGQYLSLGTVGAWTAICPLARGKWLY